MYEPAELTLVDAATNPHLAGVCAPVARELDAAPCAVTGTIPPELHGRYLRNGPNPQFPPVGSYDFPFDGDGMIHQVAFANGTATYRNRWVVTRELAEERAARRALWPGTLGAHGVDVLKNPANTNVVAHAGRTLALWEYGLPYELGADLSTVGSYDANGRIPGAMTAHPKIDPHTGELHWFRYFVDRPELVYGVTSAAGDVVSETVIALPKPAMVHDFVLTDMSVVFIVSPFVFDERGRMQWEPELGTRVGVLTRGADGGRIRWSVMEPFFMFHIANGWTDRGATYVDFVRHDEFVPGGPMAGVPHLHRLRVDPMGKVAQARLDDESCEFPRIDDRMAGRKHHYTYYPAQVRATDGDGPVGANFDALVRYDVERRTTKVQRFGVGAAVGEAVFVPRPGGHAEDDGWLLVYVQVPETGGTDLVVVDAGAFDSEPVARVHMPQRVPVGLHGNWLAD